MLIVIHTAVGATIGVVTGNPYLAAPLAFSSHYLIDGLPHFELSSFRRFDEIELKPKNWFEVIFVFCDLLLSFAFLLAFKSIWSVPLFFGFFFGVLPDFIDNVFLWSPYLHRLPIFKELYQFHKNFHFTARGKKIWLGILTQLIIFSLCFFILKCFF